MKHQENKKKNTFFLIAMIVVGVLFVFAFAQTMQVNALKTEMKQAQSGAVTPLANSGSNSPVPSQAPAQQPAMVGGC